MAIDELRLSVADSLDLNGRLSAFGLPWRLHPSDPAQPLDFSCEIIRCDDFVLGRSRGTAPFALERTRREEELLFMVPLTGSMILERPAASHTLQAGESMLMNASRLQQIVVPQRHRSIFFTLPVETVSAHVGQQRQAPVRLFFDKLLMTPDHQLGTAMLRFAWLILDLLDGQDKAALSDVRLRRGRDGFLDLLCELLGRADGQRHFEPVTGVAMLHVREAEAFMLERCHEPIGVADVAAHLGISLRALQLAFQAQRGCTPLQSLQKFRLEGVRTTLAATATGNIEEVAARWGFGSTGRLISRYRALFGETPRQTARRARARPGDEKSGGSNEGGSNFAFRPSSP